MKQIIKSCLFVYISLLQFTFVQSGINNMKIRKITDPVITMIPIGLSLTAASRLHCATTCRANINCYSFYYKVNAKNCTLGSWLVNTTSVREQGAILYSQGSYCDTRLGFTYRTYGNVSTCLSLPGGARSYTNAQAYCKALNANLYTLKVIEKLYMMKVDLKVHFEWATRNEKSFWMGMNNFGSDTSVYRWEDDGSVFNMNSEYKTQIFSASQPDNPSTQRCVAYSTINLYPLHDYKCTDSLYHYCEKKPYDSYP